MALDESDGAEEEDSVSSREIGSEEISSSKAGGVGDEGESFDKGAWGMIRGLWDKLDDDAIEKVSFREHRPDFRIAYRLFTGEKQFTSWDESCVEESECIEMLLLINLNRKGIEF